MAGHISTNSGQETSQTSRHNGTANIPSTCEQINETEQQSAGGDKTQEKSPKTTNYDSQELQQSTYSNKGRNNDTVYQEKTKPPAKTSFQRVTSQEPISLGHMFCSWRFITTLLLLYSLVVGNLPKLSMGMALICMVDQTNSSNTNISLDTQEPSREYEFDWSSEILGLILASTNFTQFISPLFGDMVRRYIGNKLMMTIFYSISAVLLFLTPTAARISPYAMMGMCMLQGCVIQVFIT